MNLKTTKRDDLVIRSVLRKDTDLLKSALQEGGSPDASDMQGRTALMNACIDGWDEGVQVLLQSGADPSARDRERRTALHFAALGYRVCAAEMLLESGVEVDSKDLNGNTPLSDALFESRGRDKMIRLLLSRGADMHLKNEHGVSPFELARTIANYDLVSIIGGSSPS